MSKGGKKSHSEKRKLQKKRAKDARRALYKSYSEAGRVGTHERKKSRWGCPTTHGQHEAADCGNPGCNRCYPQFRRVTHGAILSRC